MKIELRKVELWNVELEKANLYLTKMTIFFTQVKCNFISYKFVIRQKWQRFSHQKNTADTVRRRH